ncbi:MAG: PadR family transcriptional regulator [Vicinamibacterales bacterium]
MGARTDGLSRSAFLVLLALADQPAHGLAIIDRVADATGGEVRLGPGTLYGTLQKLVADGLIRETAAPDPADDDPRRRYYRLTPKAQREVRQEAVRLRSLVQAAVDRRILEDQ